MHNLGGSIKALRPFVPAKNFAESRRFYTDLGFSIAFSDDNIAVMELGSSSFLLQNYYAEAWAANCMIQLLVSGLDDWWQRLGSTDWTAKYAVKPPTAPKLEPWGMRVIYLWDPSGVLWHLCEIVPQRTI